VRVGILSLIHESNTFSHTPTTLEMFRRDGILTGSEIADHFSNGFHEISGFLEGLKEEKIEAAPLFYASTPPSGRITGDACDTLIDLMFEQVEGSIPLDGFLVAPHGANAGEGEDYHDLDGFWLSRLRHEIGPDTPIICTIDPHANLSSRMIAACDATIAYRTNPHLDQKLRGLEAASLMARTLRGEVRPVQEAAFPAVAIGIERQDTSDLPCLSLYEQADRWLAKKGVISNSIVLGFPYADVPEMGSSFIAVTDNDRKLARRMVDSMSQYLIEHRCKFVGEFVSIPDAVDAALDEEGPVCLLDMGDNVGGGSTADGTYIAYELLSRSKVQGRGNLRRQGSVFGQKSARVQGGALEKRGVKAFLCLYDPGAVAQSVEAGVGNRLRLSMGGKQDDRHGPPIESDVQVRGIFNGQFSETTIRHGGKTAYDMGQTAVVEMESGLTISLTTRRTVPVSLGMMTSLGLDPSQFQVLIAKGVHAPTAAYAPVSKRLIRVNTPGATSADMRTFTYRYRRRPLYPFENQLNTG